MPAWFLLLSFLALAVLGRVAQVVLATMSRRKRRQTAFAASQQRSNNSSNNSSNTSSASVSQTNSNTTGAKTSSASKSKWRVMAVLGSGGHTSELMAVLSAVPRSKFASLEYILAETDKLSRTRIEAYEASLALAHPQQSQSAVRSKNASATADVSAIADAPKISFTTLPRSREVGQSFRSSILTTAKATLFAMKLVFSNTPDLLVVNGPGTCVPLCWSAFALRLLGLRSPRVVFIESFARVSRLSLSGYLLYPIVDRFVVQWPQQAEKFAYSEYIGTIC